MRAQGRTVTFGEGQPGSDSKRQTSSFASLSLWSWGSFPARMAVRLTWNSIRAAALSSQLSAHIWSQVGATLHYSSELSEPGTTKLLHADPRLCSPVLELPRLPRAAETERHSNNPAAFLYLNPGGQAASAAHCPSLVP